MYSHEDLVNNQRFMYTYDLTGRLVRQSVLNGSKKRIYDAEYGYDMNKTCVITVAVTTSIFFILADDITGIGVVDDIAIIPLIYIFEVLEEIS